MTLMVYITYPDERYVPESQIRSWASDELANHAETQRNPDDISLEEAVGILNDYGNVTVANSTWWIEK